jgi:hypothetical protein
MEVVIWNGLGDLFHMATTPKGKPVLTAVVATAVGITIKIQNPIVTENAVAIVGQDVRYYWSTYRLQALHLT